MISTLKQILFQDIGIVKSNIHLAILEQPFLDLLINGEKRIETRFSTTNREPFKKVYSGDIVFLKESGKPIIGYFIVMKSDYFINENDILSEIKEKYSNDICAFADPKFWEKRNNKKYISLIWVNEIKLLEPFGINKKDRRGWISFQDYKYNNVILISGKIGSGKSYWVKNICDYFHFDYTNFSEYIKYLCIKDNKEINRENLQKMGEKAVEEKLDEFIYYIFNCCIEKKSDTILIDGLRHRIVFDKIKSIYHNTKIIFVDCPDEVRKKRIEERDGIVINEADQHSTESEYDEIKKLASYIINNDDFQNINETLIELQDIVTFYME